MHSIALPSLTAALGRPVVALVEPLCALPTDVAAVPEDALVLEIVCPAADVLLTMPATSPGTADYTALDGAEQAQAYRAWEDWVDRFLARAIHRPRLERHEVPDAIGADREHLATSLLRCWSFAPEVDGSFPRLPAPAVRDMLGFLAVCLRRPPSELVRESLAAFIFDWRVLLGSRASTSAAEALTGD